MRVQGHCSLSNDFGQAAGVAADDGCSACHCFERWQAKAFVGAGKGKDGAALIEKRPIFVGDFYAMHQVFEARFFDAFFQIGEQVAVVAKRTAGDNEGDGRFFLVAHLGQCLDEYADVFAHIQAADVVDEVAGELVAAGDFAFYGVLVGGWLVAFVGGKHDGGDVFAGYVEMFDDVLATVLREGDEVGGAAGGLPHEGHICADEHVAAIGGQDERDDVGDSGDDWDGTMIGWGKVGDVQDGSVLVVFCEPVGYLGDSDLFKPEFCQVFVALVKGGVQGEG